MSELLDSIYRKGLLGLLDDLSNTKFTNPYFVVNLSAALEGDQNQEIDINLLAKCAATEIRQLNSKVSSMERRLKRCAEIMECNDPLNFAELFDTGEPAHPTTEGET